MQCSRQIIDKVLLTGNSIKSAKTLFNSIISVTPQFSEISMSNQDDGNDTLRTAILYRDQKTGTAMIHPFDPRQIDDDDIQNFFKLYKCYDILHQNTKMVSLDTRLRLRKALHAMMEQGVRACPLWSTAQGRYVGMLTITDFIR